MRSPSVGAGGALESQSSLPFLTDTQRAALDAALASKQRRVGGPFAELDSAQSWLIISPAQIM